MSSDCDAKSRRIARAKRSNACHRYLHDLCRFVVSCPCTCHVAAAEELLEQLLEECDQRAAPPEEPVL